MMTRIFIALLVLGLADVSAAMAGPYAPPAGEPGSTAVPWVGDDRDPRIIGWATGYTAFSPGPNDISNPTTTASWGTPSDALFASDADAEDTEAVVSLGDGGHITVTFDQPFGDGPGPDFAVFENGFKHAGQEFHFLELAFVEVSSDGANFHRFSAVSLTQTDAQVGYLGTLDATNLHNLAGKYERGYGTPFDLAELSGKIDLNISAITHVRIVDVVGSLDPEYARYDSLGNPINDPWRTDFDIGTGGFDLDAVAIMNIPEPGSATLCFLAIGLVAAGRRRLT